MKKLLLLPGILTLVTWINASGQIIVLNGKTCTDSPIELSLQSINMDTVSSVQWHFDGTETVYQYSNSITKYFSTTGYHTMQAEILSKSGKTTYVNGSIDVKATPDFEFTCDRDTTLYEGVACEIGITGTYQTIQWNDNTTGSTITINESSTISATVTNSDGCTLYKSLLVNINRIQFPQGFTVSEIITVNNDGINDVFIVADLNEMQPCKLSIYTPQGELLYENEQYDNSFKAEDVPTGAYVYVLEERDEKAKRGVINIINNK